MKKSIFILLFSITPFLLAQKSQEATGNLTVREVQKLPIFPGCESIDANDKAGLIKCMQSNLNELLADNMSDFHDKMEELEMSHAALKIQFVIDKEGKITQIEAKGEQSKELNYLAELSMQRIASSIPACRPGELEDGSKVNMVFQLPVRYQIELSKSSDVKPDPLAGLEFSEIVVSTLVGEKEIYEVRMLKDSNKFKVYEVSSDSAIFLGTFKSPVELKEIEPYKSLIPAWGTRQLLAQAKLADELLRFYTIGDQDVVEIYKVENGKETLKEKITPAEFESNREYMQLLLR